MRTAAGTEFGIESSAPHGIIPSYSLFTKLQRPSVFVRASTPPWRHPCPLLRIARTADPPIFPTRIYPPFDELLARVRTRTLISWNAFPPLERAPVPSPRFKVIEESPETTFGRINGSPTRLWVEGLVGKPRLFLPSFRVFERGKTVWKEKK